MKNIAVIGAGTMGNGIAHTFAQKGFTVFLIDISEKSIERGMATIIKNLDRMISKGTITEADQKATTSKNASTQTGDVAPIAVLVSLLGAVAVVAFVAKKKEA